MRAEMTGQRATGAGLIAQQAVAINAKTLWLQLRIVNFEAARVAEEAGLNVVMDRCIKIDGKGCIGSA